MGAPAPMAGSMPTNGTTSKPGPSQLTAPASFQVDIQANRSGHYTTYPSYVPLSQRTAPPLDLSTVERRGQPSAAKETRRVRPHGLQEAPCFRPSEEDFKDPFEYIRRIRPEAERYGICKIIPPDTWQPDFAINTERFFFKTRRQELNSVEGSTRTNLQYLDQLVRYHKQHGMNLNRFPSVDKRPLDLYKLKKAVESRGGFDKVCKLKKWAEIGRDLGYSGKIMSSLSTSLKNSYQKWLHPYEEYLKVAKPGVQQQLELENGGPFTPSSAKPAANGSQQGTPTTGITHSPAYKASAALHASIHEEEAPPEQKPMIRESAPAAISSGFTAVNTGGFTAVNRKPAAPPPVLMNVPTSKQDNPNNYDTTHSPAATLSYAEHQSSLTHGPSGQANPLKRPFSRENSLGPSLYDGVTSGDLDDPNSRRSKRSKKAPTVVGSHMNLVRPSTPRSLHRSYSGRRGEVCEVCGTRDERSGFLICDGCECGFHQACVDPPVQAENTADWHCQRCLVGTGDFGFEEGGIYSLKQFQEKARHFKETYFEPRMQYDPILNKKKLVGEDDVEREFWRLVESPSEEVEVEYGADIHSTTHGSGFPTMEKAPGDPYSSDYWNLNILPFHQDSLFKYIKSDVSGMTIPWLYVGMCFSTFCWHNEDHYGYSANYQHLGATKTWYGIPGADAERFEQAMREAVPELFESQPDLLFQLVTLLPPDRLIKAGVNVYALDQRAGQFVITFPQAYHAGFNHGFNFNEAVNFAPEDWEKFGEAGVERLQEFRKQPCFSHDELLLTAADRDTSIKIAKWLGPALDRLERRERGQRDAFAARHQASKAAEESKVVQGNGKVAIPGYAFELLDHDLSEQEYQCCYCKAYSYLSNYKCDTTGAVMCMLHAGSHDCCETDEEYRFLGKGHQLRYRISDDALRVLVQRVVDRANQPEAWQEKVSQAVDDVETPSLKTLRTLVAEGERIPWDVPGLDDLKCYVTKCNEWVEEAQSYITRKQQNRRKNERAWRKSKDNLKLAEMEEREKETRKIENVHKLLSQAAELSFECPEIMTLTERSDAILDFQKRARSALATPRSITTQELEELAEAGKGFNVDVPEVDELERFVKMQSWLEEAEARRQDDGEKFKILDDIKSFIARGLESGATEADELVQILKDLQNQGEIWESKAQELMSMENINHTQLEALSFQADALPITVETRAAVDAILSKQREAQKQVISLFERSSHPDFRCRPKYKEVKDTTENLSRLNSKPRGTLDLENAVKRHENWMRKGKKLFGKANAPLHILQSHMRYVADHNNFCFDLSDKPRMPVEPATRDNSPAEGEGVEGVKSEKNVFCMCRQAEAGTMLECELCLEWYHGKCLKIARGKVKEDDKYNCPICDWRVKIPRDAARPKLEDLMQWQEEMPDLPFQPDEEAVLEEIVSTAQAFRDFLRPHINPMMTNPEEVTTQRFYLRKIEGAEILLGFETNFFRQEVHKWAPVAKEAPPALEVSLSTRKPRPTKQQKLMQQHGVNSPEELPLNFRSKPYNVTKAAKSDDAKTQPASNNRPASSHSGSTDMSSNGPSHSHVLNPIDTSTQEDASYAAHFPLPASHNPHQRSESPHFANSPYFSHQNGSHSHPSFGGSPTFNPAQAPLSASQPPDDIFAASDEGPFEEIGNRLPNTFPSRESFLNGDALAQPDAIVDHIFEEFVSHPEDELPEPSHTNKVMENQALRENSSKASGAQGLDQGDAPESKENTKDGPIFTQNDQRGEETKTADGDSVEQHI